MPTIRRLAEYDDWLRGLRDLRARTKITVRVDLLAIGNPGKVNAVGEGVSELKIDYGSGYRVYYKQFGTQIVVLLCGGDKDTQQADIARAKGMAEIAARTGRSRETLYRTLSEQGNPQLDTLFAVLAALGLRLAVKPIAAARPA